MTQAELRAQFIQFYPKWIKHFSAAEILCKTDKGTNTIPPVDLWANIIPTLITLDALRHKLNCPIIINSCYRNKTYNRGVGSTDTSRHVFFNAIDFTARKGSPKDWAKALFELKAKGLTVGGIGTYDTFVHLDTRGIFGMPFAVW